MTKTKRTRLSAAMPGREVGTAALNTAVAPTTDSTRSSGNSQALQLADFLGTGEESALPMRHLKSILHRDSRTIRLMIEAERRRGVPILSNNQTGYYLAENEDEIKRFTRSMRHRALEILRTVAIIEGVIRKDE